MDSSHTKNTTRILQKKLLEKIEPVTLGVEEIEEVTSLINQYLILQSREAVEHNWVIPEGLERFKKINELYNKLTGEEGEHSFIKNIRETIEENRKKGFETTQE